MAFEVPITDEAFGDLDAMTGFIKRQASIDAARKWFAEITGTIETLGEMPERRPFALDVREIGHKARILLRGRRNRAYKIYFKIHHTARK